jgi:glycosyltransferase involved in cell wall biosynthesis
MRICHVSPHLPPDQAANAILPAALGARAAAAGHEVTFVTQQPAQGSPAPAALAGEVRRVGVRRSASPVVRALRIDTWTRARAIAAAMDEMARGADVIHLHSNGLIIEVASAWAARRGVACVLTLYGTEIWHYRKRWPIDPFTRAYRRAGAVTFYSRRLQQKAEQLGLGRLGLSTVYPAVSEIFAPADSETRIRLRYELGINEPLVLLNVKRLHELAGQRYLIDAFARVGRDRDDLRLILCGTGPLRQALEEQARSAGIAAKVTFTGLLPNEQVARYAAVADLFILPSLLEALPTVAVEALAAGTPVLSADHPGGLELHEIFGDDVAIVPRRDLDALADGISSALEHPRRTRVETADRVRKHFSPAAIQESYMAIYRLARRS